MPQKPTLPSASKTYPPAGYLTFALHAHLPYVVNHGTWPHGIEWLHEAAAETYLPLLRVFANLERDGIALHCNLDLSPILLEQFAHPVFRAEFPGYLNRKITAAREDEAFFRQSGSPHLAYLARFWQSFYAQALADFQALNQDIAGCFRRFHDTGQISLITSCATHSYLPLLGTDESVRAQVRTGIAAHRRHLGSDPDGLWSPEFGYRPAGPWQYPVASADGSTSASASFNRIGVEQALAESSIGFFFADSHLVEHARRTSSASAPIAFPDASAPSLYRPHTVGTSPKAVTTVFPRDPRTAAQVWSNENGYPGDPNYLDFHKKRFPGGHRYWKVTGDAFDIADKQIYYPDRAAERIGEHAHHFVQIALETLAAHANSEAPPILCAPFDADLFGHWWFEGPAWLEAVARAIHAQPRVPLSSVAASGFEAASDVAPAHLELITCARYLQLYPPQDTIAMQDGSWGAGGNHHVWLNPETSWTYTHIYAAELATRAIVTDARWQHSELGARIVRQLCRELLLLESSDWQFLITTGAARDYAERRFLTHRDQFLELKAFHEDLHSTGSLAPVQLTRLAAIEERDSIFPDIDPTLWAKGAHATPIRSTSPKPTSTPRRKPAASARKPRSTTGSKAAKPTAESPAHTP